MEVIIHTFQKTDFAPWLEMVIQLWPEYELEELEEEPGS